MLLSELKLNEKGIISCVNGDNSLKRRFLDLGFLPGEIVKCVLISPFRDPKAYKINNNIIAIRNSDAEFLEVLNEGN